MEKFDGYIITESAFTAKPKIISDKADITIIETILQEAEVPNRNKRKYTKEALFGALKADAIQEKLQRKSFVGEAGHPIEDDIKRQTYIDQTRISHIITSLDFQGNLVKGTVESANTACGKDFQGLIRQGTEVSFSMRGLGGATKKEGDLVVVNSPLMVICYDWVMFPSHANAYMEKIIQEDVNMNCNEKILTEGRILPVGNMNQLMTYIKEQSNNVKELAEAVGFNIKNDGSNMFLDRDRKMVNIKENGDILKIYLEDMLVKELDEYMLRF